MKQLFFIMTFFLLFSCEKEADSDPKTGGLDQIILKDCGINPLENIDWLKKLVEDESNIDPTNSNGLEITQYNYENRPVFLINNCLDCSDNLRACLN